MARIDEILQKIAEAIYGKDVRSSIHDGIKLCYEEGQTAKNSAASSATDAASAKTEAEDFIATVQEKLDKGELTGKGLTILGYYDTLEALQTAVGIPSASHTRASVKQQDRSTLLWHHRTMQNPPKCDIISL